ncbi:hypothetical protein GUJ93_ZPchr0002g25401 [Zizania palustris]|uniref:Uncharacterized protein n=1 Tax=Zizania palustris TaxID=103762 RepID=A0A8J5RZB3_ZIZPA|nr:hypothetical protein GUJ93_ZPchr0002g25401 [Zizania palustris]
MRIKELRDGAEGPDEREEASGKGRGEVVTIARLRAKRALIGAGARVLFYPTLLYHVLRNRFEVEFRWWDCIDQDNEVCGFLYDHGRCFSIFIVLSDATPALPSSSTEAVVLGLSATSGPSTAAVRN